MLNQVSNYEHKNLEPNIELESHLIANNQTQQWKITARQNKFTWFG